MKKVKKVVRVNTKLAKRQIRRNDSITNCGLVFLFGFILPTLTAVTIEIVNNGSNML